MATVPPSADQAADLLQDLSLDSQAKTREISNATKKPSKDSSNVASGIQLDRSVTPILSDFIDPTICYLPNGYTSAYYYSGYDGSAKEWEDYTRYVKENGLEMAPGVYGDNGSLMYNHVYGYSPYGPYSPAASPVPTVGPDGQIYGAQHYQYSTPYFQSFPQASGPCPTPTPAKGEIDTSAAADQGPLSVDSTNTKCNGIANRGGAKGSDGTAPVKNSSFNVNQSYGRDALPGGIPVFGYQDLRFGLHSPIPWLENPYLSDGQTRPVTSSSMNSSIANGNGVPSSRNRNYRPYLMGLHHPVPISGMNTSNGCINRMHPHKLYGQYGNAYRSGLGYGSNDYDTRVHGCEWMAVDSKYRLRGKSSLYNYCYESVDGLNELNRGPRTKSSRNQKGLMPVALAVKGQNILLTGRTVNEENKSSVTTDREQYNRPDFPETYACGKFFIIKSYSEDDVHKSIKYEVWSSTPNGNKKLDAAYLDAQQKSGSCPVFLFFSVNASGQFVGVAEMTGPVDFNKNVEYWQQDRWIGRFPVKWHIVKDVPNSLLKHITLENNENKPVTNSRDTQEVKLEEGLQLLKIFKDHTSKQCILDDFDFYEDRQQKIQERKAKQLHFPK